MRPRSHAGTTPRLLRAAEWGQVSLLRPLDGPALVIEELIVHGEVAPLLAFADDWLALRHPSLLPILAATLEPQASGQALRIEREAPRGSHLAEVFSRVRQAPVPTAAEERMVAALFVDLSRALQLCHARGLVAGVIAPETLFLCPPGQEDVAPVRLHDAGLPQLLARATQSLDAAPQNLDSLLPTAEVTAPEVLAGQEPGPAADVYALCATAFFCLTRRHLHAAPTPALVRHHATQGLEPTQVAALLEVAPALGPVLARGLAVHPWGRAGVLAELVTVCEELIAKYPTILLAERRIVAPWAIGSPLVPLAAYAGSQAFADRFGDKAAASGPTAQSQQQPATELDADAKARLRAALQRLDAERMLSQTRTAAQGRSVLSYVVVLVVFLLVAVAMVAIGLRQTRRFEDSLDAVQRFKPGEVQIPRVLPPPVPPPPVRLN